MVVFPLAGPLICKTNVPIVSWQQAAASRERFYYLTDKRSFNIRVILHLSLQLTRCCFHF